MGITVSHLHEIYSSESMLLSRDIVGWQDSNTWGGILKKWWEAFSRNPSEDIDGEFFEKGIRRFDEIWEKHEELHAQYRNPTREIFVDPSEESTMPSPEKMVKALIADEHLFFSMKALIDEVNKKISE